MTTPINKLTETELDVCVTEYEIKLVAEVRALRQQVKDWFEIAHEYYIAPCVAGSLEIIDKKYEDLLKKYGDK
jgi:hypothetical protein